MTEPKVTVLMANYNGARFLRSTIESVLRQNFMDFEFLIIDDGSTDDSLSILQSFNDERIKIYRNPSNIGQTKSLNTGLQLARGEYVARIDADDIAFSSWLEYQFLFLSSNLHYAVVSAPAIVIDQHNQIKKILNSFYRQEDLAIKILTATPINHVGSLMRKDIVLQVGGYNENFKVAADFELWSELMRRNFQITSTRGILMAIRVHEQSVSSQEKQTVTCHEVARIIEKNFSSLAHRNISTEEAAMVVKIDYWPESLTSEEIEKISDILRSAGKHLVEQSRLDAFFVHKRTNCIVRAIYIKKIFECIEHDHIKEAKTVIKNYLKRQGPISFAFLLLFLAWGGRSLLRCVPRSYEYLLKISAKVRVKCLREHMALQLPGL